MDSSITKGIDPLRGKGFHSAGLRKS